MKVAILGDFGPGYICPMMRGLDRMLRKLGCQTVLPAYGIKMLSESHGLKGTIKTRLFRPYLSRLAQCDAIVVVQHLRDAFRSSLKAEELRLMFPDKPIILYDLVYLPTVGLWGPWLEKSEKDPVCGLERYDWYLCVSAQNRLSMPPEDQPCSEIGIDLNDGTLFPDQRGEFRALVDFEREAYPHERKIQLEALRETETDYTILCGRYSIADIRTIYRTCSIYFLAHMESFGVPICELQACGSLTFTPYASWCDAHRLPTQPDLPPNVIVYNNDKDLLIQLIQDHKEQPSPQAVVARFLQHHSHFMTGNLDRLQNFLDRLTRGDITSRSHLQYRGRTARIPPRGADTIFGERSDSSAASVIAVNSSGTPSLHGSK